LYLFSLPLWQFFVIKLILQSKRMTFVFVAFAYLLIHAVNNVLTEFLYLLPGAHLVHIPSGFKLFFVLIAGWVGALGIAAAALAASVIYQFQGDLALGLQLAIVNGLAPLMARIWVVDNFRMNDDLSHVTLKQLIAAGLIFALINSALNQIVLYWNAVNLNFQEGTLIMVVGDLTGAYIVFLMFKLLSKKLVKVNETDNS
jgi:hypothetical protein